jgi:hypothetical protein
MKIRTEFKFTLPKGIMDKDGNRRKTTGVMRLIKVKDLMQIQHDTRVKESDAYFYVVLLSRTITRLGDHEMMNAKIIENLVPEDFAFLIDFLNEINHKVIKTIPVTCSACKKRYLGEFAVLGEH